MPEMQRCMIPDCNKPAAASLETRPLCGHHFISICSRRLEEYALNRTEWQLPDEIWAFLSECTPPIAEFTRNAKQLDHDDRLQLLEILLRASALTRHMRRSLRKKASLPVRLRWEGFGQTWEEETTTVTLSRYGALVECQHPVKCKDILLLERSDTHKQARGEVVWLRQKWPGRQQIGIKLLNCENFWELDWSAVQHEHV